MDFKHLWHFWRLLFACSEFPAWRVGFPHLSVGCSFGNHWRLALAQRTVPSVPSCLFSDDVRGPFCPKTQNVTTPGSSKTLSPQNLVMHRAFRALRLTKGPCAPVCQRPHRPGPLNTGLKEGVDAKHMKHQKQIPDTPCMQYMPPLTPYHHPMWALYGSPRQVVSGNGIPKAPTQRLRPLGHRRCTAFLHAPR